MGGDHHARPVPLRGALRGAPVLVREVARLQAAGVRVRRARGGRGAARQPADGAAADRALRARRHHRRRGGQHPRDARPGGRGSRRRRGLRGRRPRPSGPRPAAPPARLPPPSPGPARGGPGTVPAGRRPCGRPAVELSGRPGAVLLPGPQRDRGCGGRLTGAGTPAP
ncbi:hypothetical protein SGPA1_12241 [Streptomyces misionensis JCM 4497]